MIATNKNSRGFTLIELLVVIAIIGTLSTIALTSLNAARDRAKRAKAQTEISQMYDMILRYNLETGSWPKPCSNMDTVAEWNGAWNTEMTVPRDPWGDAYYFDGCPDIECESGKSSVCSAGKNRVFESQNRADRKVKGDDICIYFEPEC